MKKTAFILVFAVLILICGCSSPGKSEVSLAQSEGANSSEESAPQMTGKDSPEEVVKAATNAVYGENTALLISVLSEAVKAPMRGASNYDDTDLANLMSAKITAGQRDLYRVSKFMQGFTVDSVEDIEKSSEIGLRAEADFIAAGLKSEDIERIVYVTYTINYIHEGKNGSDTVSKYCVRTDGKWYLLFWEGGLYD